jgi:hypothetical protein
MNRKEVTELLAETMKARQASTKAHARAIALASEYGLRSDEIARIENEAVYKDDPKAKESSAPHYCCCNDPDFCLRGISPEHRGAAIAFRRAHGAPVPANAGYCYSPLAWQLAVEAPAVVDDDGDLVIKRARMFDGSDVEAAGRTSNEATWALAEKLDCWSAERGMIEWDVPR